MDSALYGLGGKIMTATRYIVCRDRNNPVETSWVCYPGGEGELWMSYEAAVKAATGMRYDGHEAHVVKVTIKWGRR